MAGANSSAASLVPPLVRRDAGAAEQPPLCVVVTVWSPGAAGSALLIPLPLLPLGSPPLGAAPPLDAPDVPEPEVPEVPEAPDDPEVPEAPDDPEVPDVPDEPEVPASGPGGVVIISG